MELAEGQHIVGFRSIRRSKLPVCIKTIRKSTCSTPTIPNAAHIALVRLVQLARLSHLHLALAHLPHGGK